jgi:non-specific serine/threonine protein kinase
MELAKDVILEALDDDHRILIFSQFTSVLAIIRRWLDEAGIPYEYLDGSTKDRMERVERFNKTPTIPVFLLSLKAGGTGLNLTGADTVIHYDQWWNPMVENQATDRSHRIGQEKPVTSIKLIIRETIEERVLALQESKRELFQQLLAGTAASISEFSAEDVGYLLGSEK